MHYAQQQQAGGWTLGQVGVVLLLSVVGWLAIIGAWTVLRWVL